MKMPRQDNNNISSSPNLQLASWLSPAHGSLSQNDISPAQNSRYILLRYILLLSNDSKCPLLS